MKTEAQKLLSSGEAVNFDPSQRSKGKKKRRQKDRVDDEEENESQMDDGTTRRNPDTQQRNRKKRKDDSGQKVQQIKKKILRKQDKSSDGESRSRGKDADLQPKEETETPGEERGEDKDELEELSPEEVRKMERKLKKMRKKEAKKSALPQEPVVKEEEKKESVVHLGSVYLQTWKSDRPNWVFRKVRQVWLLRNMYNTDKVSDEDFPILLEYLAGLQGKGRETTVAEAEKLLQGQEHREEEGTGETVSAVQLERVRQVLQVLV
ncbi:protein cholesin-like [Branchiostoma floridae x Branchiostoma belcheri]